MKKTAQIFPLGSFYVHGAERKYGRLHGPAPARRVGGKPPHSIVHGAERKCGRLYGPAPTSRGETSPTRLSERMNDVKSYQLLDNTVYIYGPYHFIGILEIPETSA